MKWKIVASEQLFQKPWLNVRRDRVQLPNGRIFDEYYVLSYPTWVNVIAETTDGKLLIERQYRHGIRQVSFEICAGCVEKGETPLQGAKRELLEETGYAGGEWQELMVLSPNASTMDNYSYSYLARGVEKISEQHLDLTEDIEVYLYERAQVFDMLKKGVFQQALMVAPLWKYFSLYPVEKGAGLG